MTTAFRGLWRLDRCDGVLQIIRFNSRQYALAFLVVLLIAAVGIYFPFSAITGICISVACVTLFWTVSSIIVSYWVYDHSGIRGWRWLADVLPNDPHNAVNIHCGFDETSSALRRVFPSTELLTYNLFDPTEMTEPSIEIARKSSEGGGIRCDLRRLPSCAGAFDTVFLLFAAHEIRRCKSRDAFFSELTRIVKPGGRVVLVEHLRDANNYLAFGPGAHHFLPRKAWMRVETFSFHKEQEFAFTPFVRVFVFRRCA